MYCKKRLCLQGVRHHENRGILVYSNCLISISKSVSDGATNKSFLNIESHSKSHHILSFNSSSAAWSHFISKAPAKRSQQFNVTYRNIVGCNMLRAFGHPVATRCDVLRHVGCCWFKFEKGQIFHAAFVDVAWCCSGLARFVQQCCAQACALVRFSTRNMSQHVATRWPKACNMLRPSMFASVALKCCGRLAAACRYWANNAICCVEMLRSIVWVKFSGRYPHCLLGWTS